MPYATNDGVDLYYELDGSGETVAFIGDCGFGAWQWGWQAPAVAGPYETLVWDMRGVGRSDTPREGYNIETLVGDLEAVLKATETTRAHLVGAGLGGMVALQYARRFNRAHTLTVFGTASDPSGIDTGEFNALYPPTRTKDAFADALSGAFTSSFRDAQSEIIDQISDWRVEEDATQETVQRLHQSMEAFELTNPYELTRPALICHGVSDPLVSMEAGRELGGNLPRGTFEPVEGKRLCYIEHSRAVNDRLLGFFDEHQIQ